MYKLFNFFLFILLSTISFGQAVWKNVDADFQPLPSSIHVYKTMSLIDGKPNIAYYLEADLKDKKLDFTTDTTYQRRLTLTQFFDKNKSPLLVVNSTFFSFATNQNLNVVVEDKKLVSYNVHTISGKGKDTLTYKHPFGSAIGISKQRKADVAWVLTDSSSKKILASQFALPAIKDSLLFTERHYLIEKTSVPRHKGFEKWKMKTAVGGGPVLLQNGEIKITNNEELKFTGKAIDDKHPRTAMGYTANNKLIVLVVQGRFPGIAEGVSLPHLAQLLKDIGCVEALNLDGGGSSCMLVNGNQTIQVSDKEGQRAVPAVFMIRAK